MTQIDTRPSDRGFAGDTEGLDSNDSLDGIEGLDALDGTRTISGPDIGDRLWRFFINMRTGLFLILVLGVLSFIGTLLAQAPAGVRADPQAYAAWLESVHPKYGGWTTVFDKLGMFAVFSSVWFKGTLILLCTSILACSVNRTPLLLKLATRPRTRKGDAFFSHAPLRVELASDGSPEQAMDQVRGVLRSAHFRTVDDPDGGTLHLYADRFRWGPLGTVLAHVSFVVILLGAVLSATTGFKNTEFTVAQGAHSVVGHGTGLSMGLTQFTDAYYADGAPRDYASDLVLYKDGVVVKRQTVRVNQPMRYGGVSFFQSFFGVAAALKVTDKGGHTLYDGGVPLAFASDDGTHSIGQFGLPKQKLFVYAITPASGQVDPNIKAGQVQLEIHRDGQDDPIATEVISQGKPTTIDGLTYTFQRPRQFTGLIVSHDRGANVVWLGSGLLVAGIVLVFFFPHRRIWVRVRRNEAGTTEILGAATMRRDPGFEPRFRQLADDLESVTSSTSTSDTPTPSTTSTR